MDYISREAAIKAVCCGCNEQFGEEPCEPSECCLLFTVKTIPAADVQEVKHGHNTQDLPSLFECSVCGWGSADTLYCDTSTFNYCPNCGAKMDAEVEG